MGEVIEALERKVTELGGVFNYSTEIEKLGKGKTYVIATSLKDSLSFIKRDFDQIEKVSIMSVTLFFESNAPLKGFGALFPKDSGIEALGVLMNSEIFEKRVERGHSETWILGGDKWSFKNKSDEEILKKIKSIRQSLWQLDDLYTDSYLYRYEDALPLYGVELEHKLSQNLSTDENLYFTGNYLGGIGLSKIYDYNVDLAKKICERL